MTFYAPAMRVARVGGCAPVSSLEDSSYDGRPAAQGGPPAWDRCARGGSPRDHDAQCRSRVAEDRAVCGLDVDPAAPDARGRQPRRRLEAVRGSGLQAQRQPRSEGQSLPRRPLQAQDHRLPGTRLETGIRQREANAQASARDYGRGREDDRTLQDERRTSARRTYPDRAVLRTARVDRRRAVPPCVVGVGSERQHVGRHVVDPGLRALWAVDRGDGVDGVAAGAVVERSAEPRGDGGDRLVPARKGTARPGCGEEPVEGVVVGRLRTGEEDVAAKARLRAADGDQEGRVDTGPPARLVERCALAGQGRAAREKKGVDLPWTDRGAGRGNDHAPRRRYHDHRHHKDAPASPKTLQQAPSFAWVRTAGQSKLTNADEQMVKRAFALCQT